MPEEKKTPQLVPGVNPLGDHFRREMDTLMSRFFGGASPYFPMETAAQRTGFPSLDMTGAISPAIDINETDAAIELTAELPGLGEDDVEIELRDRRLTLHGQKNVTHEDGGELRISERSYGSFTRQLNLYNFQRIVEGPERDGYRHEFFVRGRPLLCSRINRIRRRTRLDTGIDCSCRTSLVAKPR